MGNGAGCSRDFDGVTIGKPSSASISVPHDINPSPNDIFVEETDGEVGGPIVYCFRGHFLFDFGGT